MLKRLIIILIITILIGLGLKSTFAQKYYEQRSMFTCEELILIEERLDRVMAVLEKEGSKEILNKLDQILQNQAQIKNELKIIKVRASR